MTEAKDGRPSSTRHLTDNLSEYIFSVRDHHEQRRIEEYRLDYEREHGPTDLSRRYTCMLPVQEQEWLIRRFPKHYWDGLPPFVKSYLRSKVDHAAKHGQLDSCGDEVIRLYLSGQLTTDDRSPLR